MPEYIQKNFDSLYPYLAAWSYLGNNTGADDNRRDGGQEGMPPRSAFAEYLRQCAAAQDLPLPTEKDIKEAYTLAGNLWAFPLRGVFNCVDWECPYKSQQRLAPKTTLVDNMVTTARLARHAYLKEQQVEGREAGQEDGFTFSYTNLASGFLFDDLSIMSELALRAGVGRLRLNLIDPYYYCWLNEMHAMNRRSLSPARQLPPSFREKSNFIKGELPILKATGAEQQRLLRVATNEALVGLLLWARAMQVELRVSVHATTADYIDSLAEGADGGPTRRENHAIITYDVDRFYGLPRDFLWLERDALRVPGTAFYGIKARAHSRRTHSHTHTYTYTFANALSKQHTDTLTH